MSNDLNKIIPIEVPVQIGEEKVVITPIKVREIDPFLTAIDPLVDEFRRENLDITKMILKSHKNIVQAVAVGARKDIEWVESLEIDQLVELVLAIVEANSDFFVNKILPSLTKGLQGLEKRLGGLKLTFPSVKQA